MATTTRPAGRTSGNATRDGLALEHLSLVRHVARRVRRSTGGRAAFDDLVSAGSVGLLEAAHAFDPGRGLAFATFAVPRIRGAMLDDLRAADPASRSVRARQKRIGAAKESLAATLERAPRDTEVAEALGVDRDTLWAWERDAERAVPVAFELPVQGEVGTVHVGETADRDAEPPDHAVEAADEIEHVKEAILGLADRHRVVLSLYYFEELTLRQVGQVLGVTESRVSQLRSEALRILRERVAPEA